ncbi:helix-turn-helix domain-containing protein [Brevibacillus borstelensis]|uniref:helix-turn-helix domain-containing protein n=1 Tax=Brevibacillus borstelensis TaxID=45462 RepID=UPI00287F7A25|nr:helix-turn-helix transcriptional regulator [Brevibacillus borstelensis]WNF06032.1 helix-turn-helix transcriptional regulator [Brevibacillus borstelensis]
MRLQETLKRSLRSEIEKNLKENGYTLSKFSELTGINPGSLSEILNGNPPRALTICHLDKMAEAFGYPPGWLYELYPEECLGEGKISRPRLIPYLVRCAEIGRQDCIDAAVSRLLDHPKNISILFTVAEQLFESGKRRESVPFYEFVIDNEKDSYSNQFVISQYRLFRAVEGTNSEEDFKAVIRFEPYRKRLAEDYQLDALLHLANVCYTLRRWKDVEKYADELRELAMIVYEDELRRRKNNRPSELPKTERPLIVYYGQGFLLKAVALKNMGRYEESKHYTNGYADLSWFELLDEEAEAEVEKLRLWALANSYTLSMSTGSIEVLPDYLDFLSEHPSEVLPGLVTIMKSANEFGFPVESVLERFSEDIKRFEEYQDAVDKILHLHFLYQLVVYLFKKGDYSTGLDETLRCLVLSDASKDFDYFKRCIGLFWTHLQHASDKQKKTFQTLVDERSRKV